MTIKGFRFSKKLSLATLTVSALLYLLAGDVVLTENDHQIILLIVGVVSSYLLGQGASDAGEKLGKFINLIGNSSDGDK